GAAWRDLPDQPRLRVGGRTLRPSDRPAAVPGGDATGNAGSCSRCRAGRADELATWPAARSGNDLPEVPAQRPETALHFGPGIGRRSAPLPERPAHRSPTHWPTGAGDSLAAALPGGGGHFGGHGGRRDRGLRVD